MSLNDTDDERRCWSCGWIVSDSAPLFLIENQWCCKDCFESWLYDTMTTEEIAEAVGVTVEAVKPGV